MRQSDVEMTLGRLDTALKASGPLRAPSNEMNIPKQFTTQ